MEYLGIFPSLHWWSVQDSLRDLVMDGFGVATIIALLGTRIRPVVDPTQETPTQRIPLLEGQSGR